MRILTGICLVIAASLAVAGDRKDVKDTKKATAPARPRTTPPVVSAKVRKTFAVAAQKASSSVIVATKSGRGGWMR